jgi:hypothetical protein
MFRRRLTGEPLPDPAEQQARKTIGNVRKPGRGAAGLPAAIPARSQTAPSPAEERLTTARVWLTEDVCGAQIPTTTGPNRTDHPGSVTAAGRL